MGTIASAKGCIGRTLRGNPMTFEETRAYREHATHCGKQCNLTQDDRLKKFWSDLADDWMALNNIMTAVESGAKALPTSKVFGGNPIWP